MDIALTYDSQIAAFDVSIDALTADLAAEDALATAVTLSLLTDRTAQPGDVPAADDRRGWWADAMADQAGDQFGSRLWLLAREKQLPATIVRARAYIEEALAWLIDDGLASKVTASVFAPRRGWLVAQVEIVLASDARRYRFEWNDDAQVWRLAGELH